MPLTRTTPGELFVAESPEWWLARLALRLQDRVPEIDMLERLFTGDHPMPTTDADRADFQSFMKNARSNYLALVVEAALERLRVIGILTRAEAQGSTLNEDAQRLWQESSLDADQVLVHRTALALRRSYMLVVPHPRKAGRVLMSPEDPREVITESWPDDRRDVRAALKINVDPIGNREVAYLYLLDGVYVFQGPERDSLTKAGERIWSAETFREWERVRKLPNPTPGEIPVVEFANRPGVKGTAACEFEDVIDIQNRINESLLNRLIAEKFAVIRQRMLLNLDFDEESVKDADGNDTGETVPIVPELPNDPRAVWLLQGEHLQFAETSQTSTADIMAGVVADIRDLAAITRTPPHYLLNSIVNASGDALKSAETGLVSKVREHISQFADSWERVIHLALRVAGQQDIEPADLEVRWADPESRSLAELYDAATKAVTAGRSWAGRMRMIGLSPEEIAAEDIERTQDAFLLAVQTAAATPAPGPADGSADAAQADQEDEEPTP